MRWMSRAHVFGADAVRRPVLVSGGSVRSVGSASPEPAGVPFPDAKAGARCVSDATNSCSRGRRGAASCSRDSGSVGSASPEPAGVPFSDAKAGARCVSDATNSCSRGRRGVSSCFRAEGTGEGGMGGMEGEGTETGRERGWRSGGEGERGMEIGREKGDGDGRGSGGGEWSGCGIGWVGPSLRHPCNETEECSVVWRHYGRLLGERDLVAGTDGAHRPHLLVRDARDHPCRPQRAEGLRPHRGRGAREARRERPAAYPHDADRRR